MSCRDYSDIPYIYDFGLENTFSEFYILLVQYVNGAARVSNARDMMLFQYSY